jgi:hypothetical protein
VKLTKSLFIKYFEKFPIQATFLIILNLRDVMIEVFNKSRYQLEESSFNTLVTIYSNKFA